MLGLFKNFLLSFKVSEGQSSLKNNWSLMEHLVGLWKKEMSLNHRISALWLTHSYKYLCQAKVVSQVCKCEYTKREASKPRWYTHGTKEATEFLEFLITCILKLIFSWIDKSFNDVHVLQSERDKLTYSILFFKDLRALQRKKDKWTYGILFRSLESCSIKHLITENNE